MPTPNMKKSFQTAAPDWHSFTGDRYPKEWTNDQIMWAEFKREPFSVGTIPGTIVGGIIPDLLMAMLGPSMYGDAYVAAYFNRPPGIAEENNKFAGVQVADALTYANSNAAFNNQFKMM